MIVSVVKLNTSQYTSSTSETNVTEKRKEDKVE